MSEKKEPNKGNRKPVSENGNSMPSAALHLIRSTLPVEPLESLSDEELFALVHDGNRTAFRSLVERYEERAVQTARSMLNNLESAREVAQEAFLKLYATRDRFDLSRRFAPWFFRILRNLCVDRLRRMQSGTPGSTLGLVGEQESPYGAPEQRAVATERSEWVHRILSELPAKFRTVLSLRDIEGLSCGEIGQRVGTTAGTVRWRLHHARKIFRTRWEAALGSDHAGGETE